tara:strand:+ start:21228 stop:22853 length:1626 start_codon:yes stop_codon:yes gene_type:complete
MGHVGKTVTQNVVSGSEITDGTVSGSDLASDIVISTTGAISGGTLTGTLQTASQTNVTSVGTLTNLRTSDIVGIGQASPTSPNGATAFLHIGNGDEQDVGIVLQDANEIWEIYQNDYLHFRYDTTDVLTLANGTGNVGIGTIAPATQLHIDEGTSNSYATLRLEGNNRGGDIEMYQGTVPVSTIRTDQSGNMYFKTSGAYGNSSVTTKFAIATAGNIGVGTDSPSFTSGSGMHLIDNYKIGFGNGGNSRPDFQLGYSSSADRLHLACGYGSDDADVQITTGGQLALGTVGGGAISHNIQIKDNAPEIMLEETGSGGSKRISIGVTSGGTPFINAEQSGGIIDVNLSGVHTHRFGDGFFIVQRDDSSAELALKANYNSGVGTPQITMYRSNVLQGMIEAGVNQNANGGGNNLVLFAPQGEVYAKDSSGNSTPISPHNFDYIPDGASETNAWSFKSDNFVSDIEKDEEGKKVSEKVKSATYISADMTKVIRQVEKLTGEKLIYKGTLDVAEDGEVSKHIDDGSTVKDNIIADLIKRIEALEKA